MACVSNGIMIIIKNVQSALGTRRNFGTMTSLLERLDMKLWHA